MASSRLLVRTLRPAFSLPLPRQRFSTTASRPFADAKSREHENQASYRETQKSKPLPPHMTNTNSTIANDMPSVGADKAPPELLTSVDPKFIPTDSNPKNTERMMGGAQKGDARSTTSREQSAKDSEDDEMGVGEMEGASFKVEPLRRTGEDANTMRARLLCSFFSYPSILFIS